MKLLILGVGGHGSVCREIATSYGYDVEYLDDNVPGVAGKLESYIEKRISLKTLLWLLEILN